MKIAISADGMIGRRGGGQVAITGSVANRQTHLLRAHVDAIVVGAATVAEDDPALTCRLPGLASRSPRRLVLDPSARLDPASRLVRTARDTPTFVAVLDVGSGRARVLRDAGCELVACESEPASGGIALPELLEDLAAKGWSSLLVEAGARLGRALIEQDLADRLILVEGVATIGEHGIPSPVDAATTLPGFEATVDLRFGEDRWREYERIA